MENPRHIATRIWGALAALKASATTTRADRFGDHIKLYESKKEQTLSHSEVNRCVVSGSESFQRECLRFFFYEFSSLLFSGGLERSDSYTRRYVSRAKLVRIFISERKMDAKVLGKCVPQPIAKTWKNCDFRCPTRVI